MKEENKMQNIDNIEEENKDFVMSIVIIAAMILLFILTNIIY